MKNGKIETFTDLEVWKEGHALVLQIYTITKNFPKEEKYSLIDQMRRSASSVTANIAEGFGRRSYKEKLQFYYLAQGSLNELKNFMLIGRDVEYLTIVQFSELAHRANHTHKILQGLLRSTRSFIAG